MGCCASDDSYESIENEQNIEEKKECDDLYEYEAADYELKNTLLVIGYIRIFTEKLQSIPNDLMYLCVLFYVDIYHVLKFSTQYACSSNNGSWIYAEKNHCVISQSQCRYEHGYILAETDPVYHGIHCWRVHTINPHKAFILWGVSKQKKYNKNSYEHGI